MSNIGYRVIEQFERPSKKLMDEFIGKQAANLGDCMNRMGSINAGIYQMNNRNVLGPAFTVKVPSGDNMMIFLAIEMAQEGDVLVIDGEGSMERALVGEMLASLAESKRLGGFIINGTIRDFDALKKMEIPVFAKGTTPNGPYRNGPGEINVPISMGGKIVNPGDIVIGDADGVIVVKPEEAEVLLEKVKQVEKREEEILKRIGEGQGMDLDWLYKKLESDGCEIKKTR